MLPFHTKSLLTQHTTGIEVVNAYLLPLVLSSGWENINNTQNLPTHFRQKQFVASHGDSYNLIQQSQPGQPGAVWWVGQKELWDFFER